MSGAQNYVLERLINVVVNRISPFDSSGGFITTYQEALKNVKKKQKVICLFLKLKQLYLVRKNQPTVLTYVYKDRHQNIQQRKYINMLHKGWRG